MINLKKYFKILGPGFITGAADDDPSGVGTYSQTGAQFGYSQLWLAPFSFPFMVIIQEMCGRIGMVTGVGLARNIRRHYPKPVLYFAVLLLFSANTINIGVDLAAMAASAQLVFNIPYIIWLLGFATLNLILQIFTSYKDYARYLKYMALALFAYMFTAFIVKQNWIQVFHSTLIPSFSFNKDNFLNVVAVLGTTISPYLFFWQASEEIEEEFEKKLLSSDGSLEKPKITRENINDMRIDTLIGMIFSNFIMFFIILTTASTLYRNGITNIETAPQAAEALRPLAGEFTFLLFALGIIGTGLLAVPTLAGSASYAIAETFGWKEGLYNKLSEAYGFYGIIIISTIIGLLINFTSIPPFKMLYYAAVLNGMCSAPLLIVIMLVSNNKKIMGKYRNSLFSNIMGWIITILMSIAALTLLISHFMQ